jgi:hypothetical protein
MLWDSVNETFSHRVTECTAMLDQELYSVIGTSLVMITSSRAEGTPVMFQIGLAKSHPKNF